MKDRSALEEKRARRVSAVRTTGRIPLTAALALVPLALFAPLPGSAHQQGVPEATAQEVEPVRGEPSAGSLASFLAGFEYRMVGPTRGGRVTAVEGHRSHPATFYMGATGGGVWRTDDYGRSWRNISDGCFESPSIGAIEVAESDPDVLYVGTGSDGIRSNVIVGRGLYKSNDAGRSWEPAGLRNAGQIGAVETHPEDSDLVYAAALGSPFGRGETRGVYRSSDGGRNWERVLFTSDSVGAVDLELHPADPRTIYAAMWRAERKPWTIISGAHDEDGIWKSTDGGDSWRRITAGLPQGLIGKVDFAVSPADADRVYALVEAPSPEQGLYRSDDAGESWRQVNADTARQLLHRPFYFTNVTADPTDADVVYVNNLRFWKSTDGGETFESISTPHGDNHDLWINPDDPRIMVQGNDGGANVTLDGGESWSSIHNQPTAELYQVDVDDRFPYWLYAGQQDNTTIAVPSLPPAEPAPAGPEGWWKAIGGCETGPAVPKPGAPDVVYANCKGRFGVFNARTGQEKQYYVGAVYMYGTNPAELPFRFQRVVPIEVSPHDPELVYHGSQFVHRTRDGGRTWETISPDLTAFPPQGRVASGTPINRDITGEEHYSTLYVIEASPHEPEVIWAGANDGPVHVTRDGGQSWDDVTPPMPPLGRVNAIEISPHDPAKAYVAAYRYLLDDFQPYLFRTEDYGETWTRIADGTNGIPDDFPVRVAREDPEREGLLYAGTDFGLFISFDDGVHWESFQQNLPVTPITDLEVVRGDLAVSTMGRSFWILDDLSPLRQVDLATLRRAAGQPAILFAPPEAYRTRYRGRGGGDGRAPEYPSPGVLISYYLPAAADDTVNLEILDSGGAVVRRFQSEAAAAEETGPGEEMTEPEVEATGEDPEAADESEASAGGDEEMGEGEEEDEQERFRRRRSAPPAEPGLQRFRWDLRHLGAWSAEDGGPSGSGPMVVPGSHRVRLTVGSWSASRPLAVRIDPRVAAEGVTREDLIEQERLALAVRDALGEARRTAAEVDSLLARLEEETEAPVEGSEELRDQLRDLRSRLVDAERAYPKPMLISQLEYLYGMLRQADQAPGRDAQLRYEELRSTTAEAARRVDELRPRIER